MLGLQALYLLLLGSACGNTAGSADPDPSGSTGGTSADLSGSSGATLDAPWPAACESFRDATTTETPQISIRNTGSVPLFVLTSECRTGASAVEVRRDGQLLDVQPPTPCRAWSCADYLAPSSSSGPVQEKRGGCSGSCGSSLRLLPPQQALQQSVGLELASRVLPVGCSRLLNEAFTCVVQVLPAPGDYTLVVRAFLDPPCTRRVPSDAGISSPATSDTGGPCISPMSPDLSKQLTFTLPTDTYFRDQEIEISAP
jgi:hypothetical protein